MDKAAMAPPKRPHKWRNRVLGFLAVCAFLEIGLRAFGYGSFTIYRPDERLLWVPKPGVHKVTEVNHLPETINSQGFRYQETLALEHPGTYRIFTFGDSVTMGWGVSDDETYSAQLERVLNSRGCSDTKFQVVSAGVNAYPNALVDERVRKVLEDGYQPDAVVIAYSFNTGFEGLADLQGSAREKFLKRVELKSIARRIALYNFLIEGPLRQLVYYRLREYLMLGTWNSASSSPDLPVSHFLRGLERAKEAADARHVQIVLLLLGSRKETYPAHPYQQGMLDFAAANHVPIVNMIDVMKSQNQDVVFMDHVHPSAVGDTMIAERLAGMVRSLDSYAAACPVGRGNGSSVTSLTTKGAAGQP